MKDVLLLIPAYNEAQNIERVVGNVVKNYPQYDYIVVNDGSKDHTLSEIRKNNYKLMDFSINLGLEHVVRSGMKYAYRKGYKYIVQFDADGQHLPEYIQPMIDKMEEGYDIVIGSRFVTEKKPWTSRMLGNRMISAAIWLTTGKRIKDSTSGMRAFNRRCMLEFIENANYGPEPDAVASMIKNGAKVAEVQVKMEERIAGTSYLNFSKSIQYMARMMMSILIVQNYRRKKK